MAEIFFWVIPNFLYSPLSLLFFQPICVLPFNSSALSSCHNRVYQSLANLIRWADQVMLDGIDLEDKENVASVTIVIKAVLDGVKVGHGESVDGVFLCPSMILTLSVCLCVF